MSKTKKQHKVVLNQEEYCYIINNRNGKIKLLEGPIHYSTLNPYKKLLETIKKKIILKEDEYAIILNPYDPKEKRVIYGDRIVIFGPVNFSLHYGEKIFSSGTIPILNANMGLILECIRDFVNENGDSHYAGEKWVIKGPIKYIPHKYVNIIKNITEISLAEHSGIYIKNTQTGKIRLEKGSQTIMLNPYEETWKKTYTKSEIKAIKFKDGFDKTRAHPLWVLENEVTKIMSEKEQKIIFGPKVILLEPYERPFIMSIAGGTPKNTKRLSIWKIKLGPNFSTDVIDVRTKDNAVLSIRLRYQWKFIIDDNDHEKIYGTSDFVGLMTEMMASIIRDRAAKHDFEELHSQASKIIKNTIFGKNEYYEFENGLRVFGVDIKDITPKDNDIASKLNKAIKTNMEIYVNKMKQKSEIELEKTKIDGQKEIEEKRKELIEIEHENYRKQELIKTKVEVEQMEMKAEAEANTISLKAKAEIKAIEEEMNILKDASKSYIKIKQLKNLSGIKKMLIIPTDAKMYIPLDKFLED